MSASTPLATTLTTKTAVTRRFAATPTITAALGAIAVAFIARLLLGGFGLLDVIAVVVVVILIGPTEWMLHRVLFHAPARSLRSRRLRTGHRHRRHHENPSELEWLLLDRRGVALLLIVTAALGSVSVAAIAGAIDVASTAGSPFASVAGRVGGSTLGAGLSAVGVAWLALVNYEWTHLLIHSRYRPVGSRARRLARNHLAHHHRDESQWFGVTTNLGDRIFGTTGR